MQPHRSPKLRKQKSRFTSCVLLPASVLYCKFTPCWHATEVATPAGWLQQRKPLMLLVFLNIFFFRAFVPQQNCLPTFWSSITPLGVLLTVNPDEWWRYLAVIVAHINKKATSALFSCLYLPVWNTSICCFVKLSGTSHSWRVMCTYTTVCRRFFKNPMDFF